jgi:hypothetical protein
MLSFGRGYNFAVGKIAGFGFSGCRGVGGLRPTCAARGIRCLMFDVRIFGGLDSTKTFISKKFGTENNFS